MVILFWIIFFRIFVEEMVLKGKILFFFREKGRRGLLIIIKDLGF